MPKASKTAPVDDEFDLRGAPRRYKKNVTKEDNQTIPLCLWLSSTTRKDMQDFLKKTGGFRRLTFEYDSDAQRSALELFASLNLHLPVKSLGESESPLLRDVQSKWAIQKSKYTPRKGQDKNEWIHSDVTFQCQCGIDHTVGHNASKSRAIPWDKVDCFAWVWVKSMHQKGEGDSRPLAAILEISGILEHTPECQAVIEMARDAIVPLHPSLREYALGLLREHSPLHLLRLKCSKWAKENLGNIPGDNHYHYQLMLHDTTSLYRTIAAEIGIRQRSDVEDNLDLWLRADKPKPPSSRITESVIHYQPHNGTPNGRLEMIIVTPEMRDAIWKFGHNKQVFMDLTFGICSARVLLLILFTCDDRRRGVPLAKFVFTARKSAKAVHADYDTSILDRLMGIFCNHLGIHPQLGEKLHFAVGMTDNDPRERTTLSKWFPSIFLLLCIYHIWHCWRNGINKHLQSVPKDHRKAVRSRLGSFLRHQINDIYTHSDALDSYETEYNHFLTLSQKRNAVERKQGEAGLKFLHYFKTYIESEAYWLSWSAAGVIEAVKILRVPVAKVDRTNNPLESYNGKLKGNYFIPHMHSGRLPRLDFWLITIIDEVIPNLFRKLQEEAEMEDYRANLRTIKPSSTSSDSSINISDSSYSNLSNFSTDTTEFILGKANNDLIKKWVDELVEDECVDPDIIVPDFQPPSPPSPTSSSESSSADADTQAPNDSHINLS